MYIYNHHNLALPKFALPFLIASSTTSMPSQQPLSSPLLPKICTPNGDPKYTVLPSGPNVLSSHNSLFFLSQLPMTLGSPPSQSRFRSDSSKSRTVTTPVGQSSRTKEEV